MRNDFYPEGTAERLLQTDFISPQTKMVLRERLTAPVVIKPSFFTQREFQTLQAVSSCMLPQPEERKNRIDVAGIFDTNFAKKKPGNGWRYDTMPPDDEAMKRGLNAIEFLSQSLYGKSFDVLEEREQHALLRDVQKGRVKEREWQDLPADKFFEELFSSLVEIYYSHPTGRDEIGDVSYADTKGWHHIQVNERDEREPEASEEI